MLKKAYGKRCHGKKGCVRVAKEFSLKVAQTSKMSTADENVERLVREIVRADRRITIDVIAFELGISHGSVHSILHDDLNMHRIRLHMIPKMLSPEQKEKCQTQCYHSGTPLILPT
ncbi:hypothetical protein AVEN_214005-1 [Araneus ventricosus]|uniref:Mos1 transposase HTH domain-containing protein n=1 Tax=Araneus ventricosus TaxID=182803 RepID=A0A4Y2NW87_ARAVE|nr:hypothetical protein AVEN_214005-1 [Araneus ventricosus]